MTAKKIFFEKVNFLVKSFFSEPEKLLKVKDAFFSSSNEHLYRFLKHVNDFDEGYILDVGAANGKTSIFFHKNFKKSLVVAFEPNPVMWPLIEKDICKYKNITLRKLALSDHEGIAKLHITANNWSSSLKDLNQNYIESLPEGFRNKLEKSNDVEVEVSTLDLQATEFHKILVIKLDTQGNELEVLKGGTETLKKTKFIISEMNNNNAYNSCNQYFEVDQFLRENNFHLIDMVVGYRTNFKVLEYDAIYQNSLFE